MALADDFEASYSADRVRQLTNPDNPGATAKDSTRLSIAANHAEARFETVVGVSYDSTNTTHVAYAVPGVAFYLGRYTAKPTALVEKDIEVWAKSLEELRLRESAFIPLPQTTSNLVPTRETTDFDVRPVSDRSNLSDMIPHPPGNQFSGNRNE